MFRSPVVPVLRAQELGPQQHEMKLSLTACQQTHNNTVFDTHRIHSVQVFGKHRLGLADLILNRAKPRSVVRGG
jgi:hypothetical protein